MNNHIDIDNSNTNDNNSNSKDSNIINTNKTLNICVTCIVVRIYTIYIS